MKGQWGPIQQGWNYNAQKCFRALAIKSKLPKHMELHMTCLAFFIRKAPENWGLHSFCLCQMTLQLSTLVLSEPYKSAHISDRCLMVLGCKRNIQRELISSHWWQKRKSGTQCVTLWLWTVTYILISLFWHHSFSPIMPLLTSNNQLHNFILTWMFSFLILRILVIFKTFSLSFILSLLYLWC